MKSGMYLRFGLLQVTYEVQEVPAISIYLSNNYIRHKSLSGHCRYQFSYTKYVVRCKNETWPVYSNFIFAFPLVKIITWKLGYKYLVTSTYLYFFAYKTYNSGVVAIGMPVFSSCFCTGKICNMGVIAADLSKWLQIPDFIFQLVKIVMP